MTCPPSCPHNYSPRIPDPGTAETLPIGREVARHGIGWGGLKPLKQKCIPQTKRSPLALLGLWLMFFAFSILCLTSRKNAGGKIFFASKTFMLKFQPKLAPPPLTKTPGYVPASMH